MRRVKSIDILYERVRDYDLVVTNDAALATALNGRVDVPRIGGFAYTPRHIAGNESVHILGTGIWGDLKIISSISEDTGYDLKFIHSELENIRTIRRYTMNVEKYLYSKKSKNIYDTFVRLPSIERVMGSYVPEEHDFFKGKRTAVIGIELFDDLDKHFIPLDHDEIDIFEDDTYSIDTIYEIGNDRQLAENIVALIDQNLANDTAIVMDTSGPIADAVRASLYRNGIPFRNTMSVKDLSQIRDYLQFLSLGLSYETLRIRHVRELFSSYRGYLANKQDGYLLSKLSGSFIGRSKELADVMKNMHTLTFQEVNERVVGREHRPQIKILIDDLGMSDSLITFKLVNELVYAVNNINDLHHNEEIPDDEKKGVLLVDCKRSVYVDRPLVIYLGMGLEWSGTPIGKEYIDRESETEMDMLRFMALLQQGTSRIYAVNSMRGGRESLPSPLFDQISEWESFGKERKAIVSFRDVCENLIKGQWYVTKEREFPLMNEEVMDDTYTRDWKFSKSSFDSYHSCPRAYMFGKIIPTAESDSTVFGNVIHEFAEFYLCYPRLVNENYEKCLEIAEEKYSGLSSFQLKKIDSSKMRICMSNIIRFIDSLKIGAVPLDRDYSKRKYGNMFMDVFSCDLYSSMTETEFRSSVHPLFGNFDLIFDERIVDYKTGKPLDAKEIRGQMCAFDGQDHYEFQPMIYLSLLRDNGATLPCRFSLFYVNDNNVRSVTDEGFNVRENVREVLLLKETSEEFVSKSDSPIKDCLASAYDPLKNNWSAFIAPVISFGLSRIEEWNDENLISSIISSVGMNDNVTNRKKVSRGLKALGKMLKTGIYVIDEEVIIPSDTLEGFLKIVDESHEKASAQTYSSFPSTPRGDCRRCNFFKVCTQDPEYLEGDADE